MVARNNHGLQYWLPEFISQAWSEHAFPPLATRLHSPGESFRGWAVTGLENLGTKAALRPFTRHAQPRNRRRANLDGKPQNHPANETTTSNSDGRPWVPPFQRRVRTIPAAAGIVGRESSALSRGLTTRGTYSWRSSPTPGKPTAGTAARRDRHARPKFPLISL